MDHQSVTSLVKEERYERPVVLRMDLKIDLSSPYGSKHDEVSICALYGPKSWSIYPPSSMGGKSSTSGAVLSSFGTV